MASRSSKIGAVVGDNNHLQSFLSRSELSHIQKATLDKINKYFDAKFREHLSTEALHESTKSRIEESTNELQSQVETLNIELERSREKITQLENELSSVKSIRDAAVDEKNILATSLQQKDAEINRLKNNITELSNQLCDAIEANSKAASLNNDIQRKELFLQEKEQIFEEERRLLTSQISALSEEVKALKSELQTAPLNNTSNFIDLEKKLAETNQHLNEATKNIIRCNEENLKLKNDNKSLQNEIQVESQKVANYILELEIKDKIAKNSMVEHEISLAKTDDLTNQIGEMQKQHEELVIKYSELEMRYNQSSIGERDNQIITSLKNELQQANKLLAAANEEKFNLMANKLTPTAAALSKLIKPEMGLTEVYCQLSKAQAELTEQSCENRRLKEINETLQQQINEKEPMFLTALTDIKEAQQKILDLDKEARVITAENNELKDEVKKLNDLANQYKEEKDSHSQQVIQLSRQVCQLIEEMDQLRGTSVTVADPSNVTTETQISVTEENSSTTTEIHQDESKSITFERLQSTNQKLLAQVKYLTEKQNQDKQVPNEAIEIKIKMLEERIADLQEGEVNQTSQLKRALRQRALFKKLYDDLLIGKRQVIIHDSPNTGSAECNASTEQTEDTIHKGQKELEDLKQEYKTYKEEKSINEKMLSKQIENMRKEIRELTADIFRADSSSSFNRQLVHLLKLNIDIYKKQIDCLQNRNNMYDCANAKYQELFTLLRNECFDAQKTMATIEVQFERLKLEFKLLKERETELCSEIETLKKERLNKGIISKNTEILNICLKRTEVESIARLDLKLKESKNECDSLKRKYEEEQDRIKSLELQLKNQNDTLNARLQEEKAAATSIRAEMTQLRQDLINRNKTNEELAKKLKIALTSDSSTKSFEFVKRTKELEDQIEEKNNEIKSLQKQLVEANERLKEVNNKFEISDQKFNKLCEEHKAYKTQTDEKLRDCNQKINNLQSNCSALESKLQSFGNNRFQGRNQPNPHSRLNETLVNLSKCQGELKNSQTELIKIKEKIKLSEEKYAHETLMHSRDLQTLLQVKSELSSLQNSIKESNVLKNNEMKKLEIDNATLKENEVALKTEIQEMVTRLEDLNSQNSILHDQIQILSTQLNSSRSESMNESGNNSYLNHSANEDEATSSEQLVKIIKSIRKEKDILSVKCDIYQAESKRLKSQLTFTETQLNDTKLAKSQLQKSSEAIMSSDKTDPEIIKKIQTLDAMTDSNRLLRKERDTLFGKVEELSASVKAYETELIPMRSKVAELTTKSDSLESENATLKTDCARWKNRVNILSERMNKTSPEDWKRLQNEREILARMLTTEKENVQKLTSDLETLQANEGKYGTLVTEHKTLLEEHMKLNEELIAVKNESLRGTDESSKLKSEVKTLTNKLNSLQQELAKSEVVKEDLRSKENKIRIIAKKYKLQYEELSKTLEQNKASTSNESAAHLNELQSNYEKVKSELVISLTNEEKSQQLLKVVKEKFVTLTAENKLLNSKVDTFDEAIKKDKSLCEGRIAQLIKENEDALAEKGKEIESLVLKVTLLQRQVTNQSNAPKQLVGEKSTSDPPTANIKPMTSVPQQSVSGSRRTVEPPLASVRPMAQVGPSAPDTHSTEYMPASSSRHISRAVALPTAAAPSTQDMDSCETSSGVTTASDSTAQSSSHSTPQQTVALVLPRMEQPSVAASSASNTIASASTSNASVNAGPPSSGSSKSTSGSEGTGVSTTLTPQSRGLKRSRPGQQVNDNKKMRVQEFSRSDEVEYQVPTSSRCDQDDDTVLADSDDDPSTTAFAITTGQMEEDEEVAGVEHGNRPESSAQSAEPDGAVSRALEASSSGTEPSGVLCQAGSDGDDSIVPSTPILFVPRRNDGFGEAVDSPASGSAMSSGSTGRFTFAEAGVASHHDTHPDLASAMPASRSSPGTNSGREDEAATVSSQGSQPSSPQRVPEEGREAEARAGPARLRSYRSRGSSPQHWPDSETSSTNEPRSEPRGRVQRGRRGKMRRGKNKF